MVALDFVTKICKYRPSLEGLFLSWSEASLFVRETLINVEGLHDYVLEPYPGEVPFHDVSDKVNGSIRMLCFWVNINLLYRSVVPVFSFLNGAVNYIKNLGRNSSGVQVSSPEKSLDAEIKAEELPLEGPQEDEIADQGNAQLVGMDRSPSEKSTSSKVQDEQSDPLRCAIA